MAEAVNQVNQVGEPDRVIPDEGLQPDIEVVLPPNNPQPMEVEQDTIAAALADIERSIVRENEEFESLCQKLDMVGISGPKHPGFAIVVLSDKDIGKDRIVKDGLIMRWVCVKTDGGMVSIMEKVTKFLMDANPKKLVLDCWNQFITRESTGKIMKYMTAVRNVVKDYPMHKVVFPSFLFSPELQPWWPELASLNIVTRNLNVSLDMTPLQLHKCLLKGSKGHKQLTVRGDDWKEHQDQSGLGKNLSEQGIKRIIDWLMRHVKKGMHGPVDAKTSLLVNEDTPAPLYCSPGFKSYTMVQFLKLQGTYDLEADLARTSSGRRLSVGSSKSSRSSDVLRPKLQGVHKKSWKDKRPDYSDSGYSASGTWSRDPSWRRDSYDRPKLETDPFPLHIRITELEGVVADLQAKLEVVRSEKAKEEKVRKEIEENYSSRCERQAHELEWQAHDRRILSEKLIVVEEKMARIADDRERLRDLRDDWHDRARDLEEKNKEQRK